MSFRCKVFYLGVLPTVGGYADAIPVRSKYVELDVPQNDEIPSIKSYGNKVRQILFREGFELEPNVWIAPGAIIRVEIEENPE